MKGLYYFTKRIAQFSQSKGVFERLHGKIIVQWEFPLTFLYFVFRYGPFKVKIMDRSLRRLDKEAKGLILCHSADDSVPQGKNFERVFVYHGTSDKVFDYPDGKLDGNLFEYYFITGQKDLYKLKNFTHNDEGIDDKVVKIGMFRSDPIFSRSYDKAKILDKYNIKQRDKKIILYAPTWQWGGGTLGRCFQTFAEKITKKYTLIIRPHYNDRVNLKYILRWQRKYKQKNLYIFHKQYEDIMDFIYIADLFIGDNSAVNYEFVLTKRPMIFVKTDDKDVFKPPAEFDIKLCGPMYDPEKDNIIEKIEEAFCNPVYKKKTGELISKSFYYNDGHAMDRACSFIVDKLSENKLINRDKVLEKYRNKFTYTENYY